MSDLAKQVIEPEIEALLLRLETPTRKDMANGTTLVYTPDSDVLRVCAAYRRQHARIKALEAGIKPFADAFLKKRIEYAKRYGADVEIGFKNFDKMPDKWKMEGITFSMGTFRHAASLLEAKP